MKPIQQIQPPPDLSSGEAMARLIADLNDKLQRISSVVPNLDSATKGDLRSIEGRLRSTSVRPANIPDPLSAPVDILSLREDLATNILPKIREAIDAQRQAINEIVSALAKLLPVITD